MTNSDAAVVREAAERLTTHHYAHYECVDCTDITLAACLRSLADRIEGAGGSCEALRDGAFGCEDDHAELTRVWAALGITEYTGKSASEHVAALMGVGDVAGKEKE